MRTKLAALLLLALPSLLWATLPGDPLQAVLKEKGDPINKMAHGNVKVLLYADAEIRLEDDKVVTVTPRMPEPTKKPGAQPKPPIKPKPKPKPTPKPKAR
jgi:hypothetical protein